jgi:hypothetical protein
MFGLSPIRWLSISAAAVTIAGCAELPNDIGVRQHRFPKARYAALVHPPPVALWNDDPGLKGDPSIIINLTAQQAFFYRGKVLVGQSTISTGRKGYETPPGNYRVIQKDAHHVSSEYGDFVNRSGEVVRRDVDVGRDTPPRGARFTGAPMPYFLRFSEGYGMHAGFVPRFRASHGCIRMPKPMAQHFFEAAEIGTPVKVKE